MRGTGIAPEQPSQASRWPPCNRADGRLIPTMKRPVVRQKRIDELLLDIAQAGANEHEVHEAAAGAVQTRAASRATSNFRMCCSMESTASAESLLATSDCSAEILRRTLGWLKEGPMNTRRQFVAAISA